MKLWQGWHNTDLGRSYFHYGPLGGTKKQMGILAQTCKKRGVKMHGENAVVSPVVCFTLATSIGAMDVLLSAGQYLVYLSHSLGTQGKLHLAGGICLELFLLSYFGD